MTEPRLTSLQQQDLDKALDLFDDLLAAQPTNEDRWDLADYIVDVVRFRIPHVCAENSKNRDERMARIAGMLMTDRHAILGSD